jgi:6-pyruvoyltetrahydropterin/6-carboxytetrahydropterin synthase
MVLDFADIKAVWKEYIEPVVDHQDLNKSLGGIVTTAENIAVWMLKVFRQQRVDVSSITVWETETSSATVIWTEVWANEQT